MPPLVKLDQHLNAMLNAEKVPFDIHSSVENISKRSGSSNFRVQIRNKVLYRLEISFFNHARIVVSAG
jgi:hypothetical protein